MDEMWAVLRLVNFAILFVAFVFMVYKGVLRMTLNKNAFHWDKYMNLLWVLLACYSIGEVLYMDTPGGPRIFIQTLIALLQLYVVVFRYDKKVNETDRIIE